MGGDNNMVPGSIASRAGPNGRGADNIGTGSSAGIGHGDWVVARPDSDPVVCSFAVSDQGLPIGIPVIENKPS